MAIDIDALSESYPGYKTRWGVEQYLFSAQGTDLDQSRKADKVEGSGFGTEWKNDLPGMKEGTLKISGLAAMKKGKVSYVLNQWAGRTAPVNAWFCTEGMNALDPITMQPSSITDSSIKTKLKDSVQFELEMNARGLVSDGFILLSPKTLLIGASGTGPIDDNTDFEGATSFGGYAQLHVWTLAGGTTPSVTVKIQHSDDDGETFTDLLTFPAATGTGSWRVKLPSTTTVNAQLQASWTVTGSPTEVQVLCGFGRGKDPDA